MDNIYQELQAAIKELKTSSSGIPVAFENVSFDQFFDSKSSNDSDLSYIQGSEDQMSVIKQGMLKLISCLKQQTLAYKEDSFNSSNTDDKYLLDRLSDNVATELEHLSSHLSSYLGYHISERDLKTARLKIASGDLYNKILGYEEEALRLAQECCSTIKDSGVLALGLDDLVETIANNHIANVYVLQNKIAFKNSKEGKRQASTSRTQIISSVQSLRDFIKVGNDMLIHKCKKDLWKLTKDDKGNSVIEKMYEGDILDY